MLIHLIDVFGNSKLCLDDDAVALITVVCCFETTFHHVYGILLYQTHV